MEHGHSCGQQSLGASSEGNTGQNMDKGHWNTQSVHTVEWFSTTEKPLSWAGNLTWYLLFSRQGAKQLSWQNFNYRILHDDG